MSDLESTILGAVTKRTYQPLKPKMLAQKLNLLDQYDDFKRVVQKLIREGRLEFGKNHSIKAVGEQGTVTGVFRKAPAGFGFVRPHPIEGRAGAEIYIPDSAIGDASTGDTVLVRIRSLTGKNNRGPRGDILRVIERATRHFVGTYFERGGQGFVRVDGTVFAHSIFVGDPGAKGARPDDKVVFEMIRFPSAEDRGEGVITEILGQRGKPGVDTLSIIRALGLPDAFPEDALEEARLVARQFHESDLEGREDFTKWLTITIDPVDARDFDDAISLMVDPKSKHWFLGVHIADVAHFAPVGTALDREARKRATSVYLPQKVLPMFPEIISNGLASLQQGKVRYVKSALIEMTPAGQKVSTQFVNAAIKVHRRFTYEQVLEILEKADRGASADLELEPELLHLLIKMRELALILQKRRVKRGALTLNMPEVELEFDENGEVQGGHFRTHDISHQIIEEFMLAANEAVAEHLDEKGIAFLRRVHPAPDAAKLEAFAEFARILGYKIKKAVDRFALQRILLQSATQPEVHAVHFSLLRSLKQATYTPEKDDHYALAMENYCHFTSPIRRYPDLVVHRLLDQLFKRGRAGSDFDELMALGEHCSKMERRAELAERELVKYKLLIYMSKRLGTEMEVIVTGVADYGFYGQAEEIPIEGLVHISTLPNDFYYFDETSYTLVGQRTKRQFRLGDRVLVQVVRVDLQRRQLDFRVVVPEEELLAEIPEPEEKPRRRKVKDKKKGGKGRRK